MEIFWIVKLNVRSNCSQQCYLCNNTSQFYQKGIVVVTYKPTQAYFLNNVKKVNDEWCDQRNWFRPCLLPISYFVRNHILGKHIWSHYSFIGSRIWTLGEQLQNHRLEIRVENISDNPKFFLIHPSTFLNVLFSFTQIQTSSTAKTTSINTLQETLLVTLFWKSPAVGGIPVPQFPITCPTTI